MNTQEKIEIFMFKLTGKTLSLVRRNLSLIECSKVDQFNLETVLCIERPT